MTTAANAGGAAAGSVRMLHVLLAVANFAVGMGAFVIIGVLSPVADSFGVSKADAGSLMTVYAAVYVVASPVLAAVLGRIDRAHLLIAGLLILLAGAVAAAAAPYYWVLLIARAVMALGGSLITPVVIAVGAASVPPERRGKALATVYGGFTLAQVLGVPVGAWLGYAFGWRVSFAALAVITLLAAVILYRMVPRGIAVQPSTLRTLGRLLVTTRPMVAVAFTVLFMTTLFVLYTYIAPFVEARHGLGRTGVTVIMLVYGLSGVAGNAMGGFLTDRIGTARTLVLLCAAQIVLLPLITLTYLPLLATGAALTLWGLFSWSVHVPQQARLAALDPPNAQVLLAMHAGALYLGGSLGPEIGGWVLEHGGLDALGPAGAVLGVLALGSLAFMGWLSRADRR